MVDLAERIQRQLVELANLRTLLSGSGAQPPGGGPSDPDNQAIIERVGKLEARMEASADVLQSVNLNVAVINTKLDAISGRIGDLGGRIDGLGSRQDETTRRIDTSVLSAISRVPSWWQMPVVIAGTVGLLGALYASAKHLHFLP